MGRNTAALTPLPHLSNGAGLEQRTHSSAQTPRGPSDSGIGRQEKWAERLAAARRPRTAASKSRLAVPFALFFFKN